MSASGISALVGAAAPGMAQGIQSGVNSYNDFKSDQKLDNDVGAQTGTGPIGTADANHPIWGLLNNIIGGGGGADAGKTAAPQQGIPAPNMPGPDMSNLNVPQGKSFDQLMGSPVQTMEDGGTVETDPTMHKASLGELLTQGAKDLGHAVFGGGAAGQAGEQLANRGNQVKKAVDGYQNGGVVRLNSGSPTVLPAFTKGPALPTGPNAGIVPASTEGQILTMDAGGVVPDGFHEQQGITGVPMSGRGAALIEGMQAGQNLGHNFQNAWNQNRARSASADYAGAVGQADTDANPNGASAAPQPSILDKAKSAVEGFFHHIHEGTLDDNHNPNSPAPGSPNAAPPTAGVPTPGSPPAPGSAPGPGASPVSAGPAPVNPTAAGPSGPPTPNPAAAAPPGAAPSRGPSGPAPAPGAGPSPGPNVPAQPGASQPQPLNPQQQALVQNPVLQNVVQQVATNPEVKAGIPDKTPAQSGQPHSLTPEYWADLNRKKIAAVQAAARAGEDPAKVYESLTAMQNAHFQGQVLKQAATASRAFDNGDMAATTQALKNINYYLPNGQDIDVRTATAADVKADPSLKLGQLVHSNPYAGMYGHENDPKVIGVDQNYIQSLGQGALDPAKMQAAQQGMYAAQMNAKKEILTAQGAYMTGQGKQQMGAADYIKADLKRQSQYIDDAFTQAKTREALSYAGRADREPVDKASKDPRALTQTQIRQLQNDTSGYIDNAVAGQPTGTSLTNPDGSPNLSMGAGRVVRDPNKTPTWSAGLKPDQLEQTKIYAGNFRAANPTMTKEDAASLGARIVRIQSQKVPPTHIEADGKRHNDFTVDAQGVAHVWIGSGYQSAYVQPLVKGEETSSPVQTGGGGSSGGGGGGAETDHHDEMDND